MLLFFIGFPFFLKSLNPSLWKKLGICLLLKMSLAAYKTSKYVRDGRISLGSTMCCCNVKARVG